MALFGRTKEAERCCSGANEKAETPCCPEKAEGICCVKVLSAKEVEAVLRQSIGA